VNNQRKNALEKRERGYGKNLAKLFHIPRDGLGTGATLDK